MLVVCAGFTVTVVAPDCVVSCTDVAVIPTGVLVETTGAVKSPDVEIEPRVALHVTALLKLPVPVTVAEHWLVWLDWIVEGEHITVTEVIVPDGFTVTVVMPDLDVSCDEVAVMVTGVVEGTIGALKTPEAVIEPPLAIHVTPELKLPVPVTDAEHWLVWPDWTVDGEQDAVTDVMVDVFPPPPLLLPPQATISPRLPNTSSTPGLRTAFLPQRTSLAWTPCGTSCGM